MENVLLKCLNETYMDAGVLHTQMTNDIFIRYLVRT